MSASGKGGEVMGSKRKPIVWLCAWTSMVALIYGAKLLSIAACGSESGSVRRIVGVNRVEKSRMEDLTE